MSTGFRRKDSLSLFVLKYAESNMNIQTCTGGGGGTTPPTTGGSTSAVPRTFVGNIAYGGERTLRRVEPFIVCLCV